jgi:hypothetical protein
MPAPKGNSSTIPRNVVVCVWGAFIGLFFGVPPAFGAYELGLTWAPYGAAVITMGVVAGLLIAYTVDALIPRGENERVPIHQRLEKEKAQLDHLDERAGSALVWRELAELELQEASERGGRRL